MEYFQSDNIRGGVRALARQRKKWMDRSDLLIRAARHYEGAAQILIRHAVMTAERVSDLYLIMCVRHVQSIGPGARQSLVVAVR